ncbi:MAG: acyltransferase family protein [Euzebya sp.]
MSTTLAPTAPSSTNKSSSRLLWLDAVRAAALLVVVVGHFLQAVVFLPAGGDLSLTAFLDTRGPVGQLLWSWPLQVMGAFFAVGGFAAAMQLTRRPVRSAEEWSTWMTGRLRRLVVPTAPLLILWIAAGPLLEGRFGAMATTARRAGLVPLWFLAVYLVIQALTPVWVRVLERRQWWVATAGLLLAVGAIDLVRFSDVADGLPAIVLGALGVLQFALVWSIPTVLGVAVHAGQLTPAHLVRMIVAALVAAAGLIAFAGYDIPVVGVTDSVRSNNSPPTLLLAMHATAYACAVMWSGPRLESWLGATPRRRRALATASTWSMPVYLWHMTGLVALVALVITVQVPGISQLLAIQPLTLSWWILRPVWLAAALLPGIGLILAVRAPSVWLLSRSRRVDVPHPIAVAVAVITSSAAIAVTVASASASFPITAVALLGVALSAMHLPAKAISEVG